MRLASELAGFTAGTGRRAAPRDGQERRRQDAGAARQLHRRAARRDGIPEKKADQDLRAHRVLSPATASESALDDLRAARVSDGVLKANYPRHFMAALLTIESQNSDKVALYLAECRELGVPDAAARHQPRASGSSSSQPEGVRFWSRRGQGRGREARSRRILETRRDSSAARSRRMFALAEHIDLRLVNKKVLESLIKAGAFDSLAPGGATSTSRVAAAAARGPGSHPRPRQPPSAAIATRARSGCSAATRTTGEQTTDTRRAVRRPRVVEAEALAFRKGSARTVHVAVIRSSAMPNARARRRSTRPAELTQSETTDVDRRRRHRPASAQDQAGATGWPSSCSKDSRRRSRRSSSRRRSRITAG